MKRAIAGLLVIGFCVVVPPARAQTPVIDVANLLQNTLQLIEAIAMVANQVIELTPLQDFLIDEQGSAEWLGFVVNMACHPPSLTISFRLSSICSEFDRMFPPRDRLPETSEAFRIWQEEKEEQIRMSAATAARAQSMIQQLGPDSESLIGLVQQIQGVIGNLQGSQVQHQISAQSNALQLRQQAMSATFERAMTLRLADEATTMGALRKINDALAEGHPR